MNKVESDAQFFRILRASIAATAVAAPVLLIAGLALTVVMKDWPRNVLWWHFLYLVMVISYSGWVADIVAKRTYRKIMGDDSN